ncbi:Digalactosyldiacylglycerol synthase 1, chloroplastic [Linum perenne]
MNSESMHPSTSTSSDAFSFISRGWQGVRDSAGADIQLIRDRANSFKNLTSSFVSSPSENAFVKKIQPTISELRRAYSAPEISKKVLEKWEPTRAKLGIDLSSIRNALVSEVEGYGDDIRDVNGAVEFDRVWRGKRRLKLKEFWGEWKVESEGNQYEEWKWKPLRDLKKRFKNSELVEKMISSLKSIRKDPQESQEVPPLDGPELLAYVCDKIVESLCSKRKNQLLLDSLYRDDNVHDELDLRIASVLQSTGHHYEGGFWTDRGKHIPADGKRHVAIVTTASLPWMTGTAVNPLFRAAYLSQSDKQNVTLLVPWLCKSDQELVYPNRLTFSSPEEQESYIRNWLEERTGFKADFKISFYPGKFSKERRSIIPMGDTSQFISSKEADIAILEEPEHLNWYHHGKRWTDKFNHVVGVVHTNYLEYIKREKNGALQAFLVKHINNWVARAYCHKVLRLSAATQDMPKSLVCNVHGVNPKFLRIGEKVAADRELGQHTFSKGAYFLGKMVWAKGYRELIDLLAEHKTDLDGFKVDVFGNGEDAHEVKSAAKSLNLNLNFLKGIDHADDSLHGYKLFINPSVSDVLCTATAEALAMGKFVVCADHPSNEFFRSFPNCLTYKSSEDFVTKVKEAMEKEPQPLTPEQRYHLSWEAATQRFMQCSDLDKLLTDEETTIPVRKISEVLDGGLAFAHYCLTGSELLRLCTGATPGTRDYDKQHCKDLRLLPPHVENPIYGW